MRKYQELVRENKDVIEQLKSIRNEHAKLVALERERFDRANELADRGYFRRACDLLAENEDITKRIYILFATIAEFEDDLRVMLYSAYENVPEHIRRQGFAGFYREAGL